MFGGLMGDFDDDPFFGGQMRRMNNMMNSMMSDFFGPPFGNMLTQNRVPDPMDPYQQTSQDLVRRGNEFGGMGLMPFGMGFPDIRSMFNMANMGGANNCHSFSSSTVMTMTNGPDGRPQVYQASTSTTQAPGGVRETKKTVQDSRTGVKKMSIGHHIGERAHVMEKSQNIYSGEQEENQELINLDEEEADDFNKEWEIKTRSLNPALTYGNARPGGYNRRHHRGESGAQLALPPAPSSSLPRHYSTSRHAHNRSHSHPQLLSLPPSPTQTTNYRSEKTELGKKRKQQQQHYEVSSTNSGGGGGRLTDKNKKENVLEEEEEDEEDDETEEPKSKKRAPLLMNNLPQEINDSHTDSDSN